MRATKLLSVALLVPSLALASGYSLPNTNPRDLGLCASGVAAQRDSGAAFGLSAALSRLRGPSARVGGGFVNIFNTWDDPAFTPTPATSSSTSVDMNLQFTPIGQASVAYGGELSLGGLGTRGWGVGFGVQPFGGAIVKWPGDWPGQYRIIEVDRRVYSFALTGGVEVLPMLRLGGGVLYYYTTQELSQNVLLNLDPLVKPQGTLELSGGAFSWNLSAEADVPGIPLTIAVDYKHQAVQDLDGEVNWAGLPPGPLPPILANQDVTQSLTIPNVVNVGLAYRATKPLLLTFTYTYDRWSVYQSDTFIGSNPGATLSVPRDYDDGHTLRAGAEYDLTPALQVRLGLQRDISGLKEEHYSPTLPDSSSWAASLGASYRFARGLWVDAALFYANMDEVETENAAAAEQPVSALPLRGRYDIAALIYGLSVGWQPGAR